MLLVQTQAHSGHDNLPCRLQLGERKTEDLKVGGSSPPGGTFFIGLVGWGNLPLKGRRRGVGGGWDQQFEKWNGFSTHIIEILKIQIRDVGEFGLQLGGQPRLD